MYVDRGSNVRGASCTGTIGRNLRPERGIFSLVRKTSYGRNDLESRCVSGRKPDIARARAWYMKAGKFGTMEASRRIALPPQAGG